MRERWFGTTRGRLGYLASPAMLVYGTGGVAYGRVEHTVGQNFAPGGGAPFIPNVLSDESTRVGWTAGGGVEYKVWQRATIGPEYLYIGWRNDNLAAPATTIGAATFPATAVQIKERTQLARLKLNVRF